MRFCNCCKKELTKRQKTYCSVKCQQDKQFNDKYIKFLNDDLDVFMHHVSTRRALTHRDGNRCSVCGIETWNDKAIVFEIEHKDGNSENHRASNLCLICPNCHSQTPTYKGANKGNGRHARRQRYADGKSY